jgi:hypothetical protein
MNSHEVKDREQKYFDVVDPSSPGSPLRAPPNCEILELTPPTALADEAAHPTVVLINNFLRDHIQHLPNHVSVHAKYHSGDTKRRYWLALILCFIDRYGGGAVVTKKNFTGVHADGLNPLKKTILAVKKEITALRKALNARGDTQRLQMQRPLSGRSLLSITTCMSGAHNVALKSLYMTAIHPVIGVDGYRAKTMASFPFILPKKLQDVLPKLTSAHAHVDVEVSAKKLTKFVENIYKAINGDRDATTPFKRFVRLLELTKSENRRKFGNLPDRYDPSVHGFVVRVPYVPPGDTILWSEYHATAGADDTLTGGKITSFVDFVPSSFITDAQLIYWRWHCRNASIDVGGGTGRGTWGDFVHNVTNEHSHFGMPNVYLDNFQRTCKTLTSRQARHHDALSKQQAIHLKQNGYLVLSTPPIVQAIASVTAITNDLSKFIQSSTLETSQSFDLTTTTDLLAATNRAASTTKTGDPFFYYSPKVVPGHELDPLALGERSKNAQAGGSLVAGNSGLGRGTSYFSQPEHCYFQCSDHVFHLLNVFYGCTEANGTSLLVVPERFRAKVKASWAGGVHIDTHPLEQLPNSVRAVIDDIVNDGDRTDSGDEIDD